MKNALVKSSAVTIRDCRYTRIRVPLIKIFYVPTSLKCEFSKLWYLSLKLIKFLKGDIQISNGLSVKTSLILRHLFEIQPEAIKFFHFMKTFLPRYNKTIEYIEDRFGGYLMELMIIFYFQSQNLMPSIKVLQENTAKEIINGNLKFILDIIFIFLLNQAGKFNLMVRGKFLTTVWHQ